MSRKKMNLFYVLKLHTSTIMENNGIVELNFKDCKNNGSIISLGDNQVLKFIRRINNKEFDKEKLDELISIRTKLKNGEKLPSKYNIIDIQNEINDLLYVPEILSIKVDTTKKDYKLLCKNGFTVIMHINNKTYTVKYKRLCAGAGQLRRNSALFVDETKYDMLEQIMMCGLTPASIGKINLAKFSAYYSLYTSATNEVSTPRICVINDYEHILKNQKIDWIYESSPKEYDIESKIMDFNMNAFDGSGMICPEMAEKWMQDLQLDYLPSSFIIRGPWMKGLVSVFDFRKFAKEVAKTDKIKDHWGYEWDINNIDVILTTSQFKMYKKYSSWENYFYHFRKYKHSLSVARVNKKVSDFVTPLNYQYIQSNNFTKDTIKQLAEPTAEWLKSVLNYDPLYVYLLLVGYQKDKDIEDIEKSLDSAIAKALLYNHEILKDEYIRRKIYEIIEKKINQAKIGKIFVEGSYDFIIPDLYAMAEHAFGMEVHGLLPAYSLYSKRWVDKGAKRVSTQRSPLVASAENKVMNVYCDDKCKEWFKYIQWGNIYSIWDTTIISQSDADFDGDLILTSDNEVLINSIDQSLPIITYEKTKAKEHKLNFSSFANWDCMSFDSPIGGITNLASNLYALRCNFEEGTKERNEIDKRIRLLRRYQGD